MNAIIVAVVAVLLQRPPSQEKCPGIYGRISMQDGSLVPGVSVTARARETKRSTLVKSNDAGEFRLCLTPGAYDVTAEGLGLRRAERKSITVDRGARAVDFVMKAGKTIVIDSAHP